MADRAHLERLTKDLIEQGKLIEAGWNGMRLAALPLNMPADRLEELRISFFAGAHHLFVSLMAALDPGDEPTATDLRRMELIDGELTEFIRNYEIRNLATKGSA